PGQRQAAELLDPVEDLRPDEAAHPARRRDRRDRALAVRPGRGALRRPGLGRLPVRLPHRRRGPRAPLGRVAQGPRVTPTVTAVVLAYGPEPWFEDAVRAVLASTGVSLDVVVVDNGYTGDAIDRVKALPGTRVLTPAENTGCAGGYRPAAAAASRSGAHCGSRWAASRPSTSPTTRTPS